MKGKGVEDSISWMSFDKKFFSPEINDFRMNLRKKLELIEPEMIKYVEKAEYPETVVQQIKKLDLFKDYISKPHGNGRDKRKMVATILELARCDASLATLYLV